MTKVANYFSKAQWLTLLIGVLAVRGIYAFGSIAFPKEKIVQRKSANVLTASTLEQEAMANATPEQLKTYQKLADVLKNANNKEEKIAAQKALAYYFQNTIDNESLVAYYMGEQYKLENSQKNLTFAANFILGDVINNNDNPAQRSFRANVAKELFDAALANDPNNDSLKIGLAGSYMHGATSDNPMTGTLMLIEMVKKDSTNAFSQKMLGYGGLQSAQYDKALNRFVKSYELNNKDTTLVMRIAVFAKRFGNAPMAEKYFNISKSLLVKEKDLLDVFVKDYQSIK